MSSVSYTRMQRTEMLTEIPLVFEKNSCLWAMHKFFTTVPFVYEPHLFMYEIEIKYDTLSHQCICTYEKSLLNINIA